MWSLTPNSDGSAVVMLTGHRRLERTGVVHSSPLLKVTVRHLRDHKYLADTDEVRATHMQLMTSLKVGVAGVGPEGGVVVVGTCR